MFKGSQLEGFCMDLLSEVAKKLGFKYKVHLVKDGSYGRQDDSGNWNGMIGEVVRGVSTWKLTFGGVRGQQSALQKLELPSWYLWLTIDAFRISEYVVWTISAGLLVQLKSLSFSYSKYLFIPCRRPTLRSLRWLSLQLGRKWWGWANRSCRRGSAYCWGRISQKEQASLISWPPFQLRLGSAYSSPTWGPPLASL